MLVGHIGQLGDIVLLIKKLHRGIGTTTANAFPAALIESSLLEAAFMELPVEEVVLGLLFAGEHGHQADAVGLLWRGCSSDFGGGGHEIGEVTDMRRLARLHLARPPGDERHADAAVREAALDASVGAVGIEALEVVLALVVRSVVAAEDDERVLREAKCFELLHHAAHIAVESCDHRRLAFVLLRPVFVRVGTVVGHMGTIPEDLAALVVRVRNDHGPVEEKSCRFVFTDELQRVIGEEIVRVMNRLRGITCAVFTDGHDDVGERFLALIAPEVVGEVIVRVVLAQVAVKVVEALLARQAALRFADIAEAPFADERRFVARLL